MYSPIQIEKFVRSLTSELKYSNWFSGLQTSPFGFPVVDSGSTSHADCPPLSGGPLPGPHVPRRDLATAHRPGRRAGPETTATPKQTRPAKARPWVVAPSRPATQRLLPSSLNARSLLWKLGAPCSSLISNWRHVREMPVLQGFLEFSPAGSLFFSKITLILGK